MTATAARITPRLMPASALGAADGANSAAAGACSRDRHPDRYHHRSDRGRGDLLGHHATVAVDPIAGTVCPNHPCAIGADPGPCGLVGDPASARRGGGAAGLAAYREAVRWQSRKRKWI